MCSPVLCQQSEAFTLISTCGCMGYCLLKAILYLSGHFTSLICSIITCFVLSLKTSCISVNLRLTGAPSCFYLWQLKSTQESVNKEWRQPIFPIGGSDSDSWQSVSFFILVGQTIWISLLRREKTKIYVQEHEGIVFLYADNACVYSNGWILLKSSVVESQMQGFMQNSIPMQNDCGLQTDKSKHTWHNRVPLWTVAMQHFSDWVSWALVNVYSHTQTHNT